MRSCQSLVNHDLRLMRSRTESLVEEAHATNHVAGFAFDSRVAGSVSSRPSSTSGWVQDARSRKKLTALEEFLPWGRQTFGPTLAARSAPRSAGHRLPARRCPGLRMCRRGIATVVRNYPRRLHWSNESSTTKSVGAWYLLGYAWTPTLRQLSSSASISRSADLLRNGIPRQLKLFVCLVSPGSGSVVGCHNREEMCVWKRRMGSCVESSQGRRGSIELSVVDGSVFVAVQHRGVV